MADQAMVGLEKNKHNFSTNLLKLNLQSYLLLSELSWLMTAKNVFWMIDLYTMLLYFLKSKR